MTEYQECQECFGWCCASFGVICELSKEEILKISEYLEMDNWDFMKGYITKWPFDMDREEAYTFRYTRPCRFWTHGMCGIHEVKPRACAAFKPLKTREWDWRNKPVTCSEYHKEEAMKEDRYTILRLTQMITEGKKGACSHG